MKKFKEIDIYITKKFLGTFFYSIVLILSIVIVFDIAENLDDFISKEIPLHDIVFDYYLNFIPYFTNLFSGLFTFIAVIYFTSKMAFNSEIIAILSNGVSFRRLMVPYIFSALIIMIISFVLGNYIIPPANKKSIDFRNKYINSSSLVERNIHRQIEPGVFIYMQDYNANKTGYNFTMERFEGKKLVEKINSYNISWNEEKEKWVLNQYWKRIYYDDHEEIIKGYQLDTTLNMDPYEFVETRNEAETYTTPKLNRQIENFKMRGVNYTKFIIEKYKRISNPFSVLILTIIGMGLASRKVKGGLGLHLGLGLLFSFSYILFSQISSVFAISGNTLPFIAVWIPNFLYAIITLFIYKWASR